MTSVYNPTVQSFCTSGLQRNTSSGLSSHSSGSAMKRWLSKHTSPSNRRQSQNSDQSLNRSPSNPDSKSHPQASVSAPTRRPNMSNSMHPNNPFADMVEPPPAYPGTNPAPASNTFRYSNQPDLLTGGPSTFTPAQPAAQADNDKFAFLREFDTVFLIDDSGSMAGSRWRETSAAIEAIAETCVRYDEDGIDIHFLNKSQVFENVRSSSAAREIFSTTRPSGATYIGKSLNRILEPYVKRCERGQEPKPMNLIVITDGEPTDDPESIIVKYAKKLDKCQATPWQVGIQFFQVGNDREATKFLQELDDDLSERNDGMRDIVDTQPYRADSGSAINADGILKTVLGAVNKRWDRKQGDHLHH